MRSNASSPFKKNEKFKRSVDLCNLSHKDIVQFWKVFNGVNGKDFITTIEFVDLIQIPQHKLKSYMAGVFALVDIEESGGIEFTDCVHLVITMCLLGQEEMIQFLFFIWDPEKKGYIEYNKFGDVLERMCHYNSGEKSEGEHQSYLHVLRSNIEGSPDGGINFEELTDLTKRYKNVFFPIFQIQSKIMEKFMGISWWTNKKINLLKEKQKNVVK